MAPGPMGIGRGGYSSRWFSRRRSGGIEVCRPPIALTSRGSACGEASLDSNRVRPSGSRPGSRGRPASPRRDPSERRDGRGDSVHGPPHPGGRGVRVVVVHGCQTGVNAVDVLPGGWMDACPLGVTGDFIIRAILACEAAPVPAAGGPARIVLVALVAFVGVLVAVAQRPLTKRFTSTR